MFRRRRVVVGLVATVVILLRYTSMWRRQLLENPVKEFPADPDEPWSLEVDGVVGKPFSPSLLPYLKRFNLTQQHINAAQAENIRADDVLFAMYASRDHFREARRSVRGLRAKFPNNRIIFYNMGLAEEEEAELSQVCNLTIRRFDFSAYPPHTTFLYNYAFKLFIIAEMLTDGRPFWMLDTSVVFKTVGCVTNFYEGVNNGTAPDYLMEGYVTSRQGDYTDPTTLGYLPYPAELARQNQHGASHIFMRPSRVTKLAGKWLLLCALTRDCITPPTAILKCKRENFGKGCHRYDQSAQNCVRRAVLLKQELIHYPSICGKTNRKAVGPPLNNLACPPSPSSSSSSSLLL